jgi:hypothetical protein
MRQGFCGTARSCTAIPNSYLLSVISSSSTGCRPSTVMQVQVQGTRHAVTYQTGAKGSIHICTCM